MQNCGRVLPLAKLKMSFRISEKTSFIVHYSLCIVHSHFAERSSDFCLLHSAFCIQISVCRNDKLKFEIFLYKYPEICYTIPNETKEEPSCSDTPLTNSSTFPQDRCA